MEFALSYIYEEVESIAAAIRKLVEAEEATGNVVVVESSESTENVTAEAFATDMSSEKGCGLDRTSLRI